MTSEREERTRTKGTARTHCSYLPTVDLEGVEVMGEDVLNLDCYRSLLLFEIDSGTTTTREAGLTSRCHPELPGLFEVRI